MRTIVIAAALAAIAAPAFAQMPAPADLVKQWDTNNDGGISKEEWTAAGRPAERFDLIDADKDGKITAAELEAAFAAMRRRQGG